MTSRKGSLFSAKPGGVVPQDSLLFDGTVQANIALSRPEASFEEITGAAQVACAHDFIQGLPGATPAQLANAVQLFLEGRQRIAIARMVPKRPVRCLMKTRAHLMSTQNSKSPEIWQRYIAAARCCSYPSPGSLRHADRILVMHQGSLVVGSHAELLELSADTPLFRQQEGSLTSANNEQNKAIKTLTTSAA